MQHVKKQLTAHKPTDNKVQLRLMGMSLYNFAGMLSETRVLEIKGNVDLMMDLGITKGRCVTFHPKGGMNVCTK